MFKHKFLTLVIATVFLMGGLLFSQEQTGGIMGTIVLEDGSAVPGVSVEIAGEKLIGTKVSVSNENGVYRLLGVPTGMYTVTFKLEGFKTIKRISGAIPRIPSLSALAEIMPDTTVP